MSIRTFVAIDTPEVVRNTMLDVQSKLKVSGADVKWEGPEKFHATIKFLGNVEEELLPSIVDTIAQSVKNFPAFEASYTNVGCFPSVKRPRVIWIGCENTDGTLLRIKDILDQALLPLGFEREERAFHPHVTLGRTKSPKGLNNLISILESFTFEPRTFTCNEILLMKSAFKSQGSEYTRLHSFALS